MKKLLYTIISLLGMSSLLTTISCNDDLIDDQGTYYTFTGEMVTDYLTNREEANPGTFSDFIEVLHRAQLWDLMSTYGTYTCFAPTNDAIKAFLESKKLTSVSELQTSECDTLAWTHIIKQTYFTTDGIGTWSEPNLNHRQVTVLCAEEDGRVIYYANQKSTEMIARDDSVVNGVVHVINHVISSTPILMGRSICMDPKATLFAWALEKTGWADYMDTHIEDETYTIHGDSVVARYNPNHFFGGHEVFERFPEKREIKYTVFVEPDSILRSLGIKDTTDLIKHAKKVYDETFSKDAGLYDKDYRNEKNPLNRFVAYHILDRMANYYSLTIDQPANSEFDARPNFVTDSIDIDEYYETMCSHTILKVTDVREGLFINRKRFKTAIKVTGARVFDPIESTEFNPEVKGKYDGYQSNFTNGCYLYVDNFVEYDTKNTIGEALNVRMRIDATTLSPDFMTSGGRNIKRNSSDIQKGAGYIMMGYKPGFVKNFIFNDDTFLGVHQREVCSSWENDMVACLGNFDIKFKLPPVPAGQTYEVRLGCNSGNARTVVQVYFDDNLTGDIPCGTPVDLRRFAYDYGWDMDELNWSEEKRSELDKSLRNQGVMKGPDSFKIGNDNMRNEGNQMCMRHIMTTKYFEQNHDYYIRLRQVLDNGAEMSLDYIEIVPKTIYNGSKPEDRH